MTFEELAYKERELFAIINKTRDAQYDELTNKFNKENRRLDFEQDVARKDAKVSFTPSQWRIASSIRHQVGALGRSAGGRYGKPTNMEKQRQMLITMKPGGQDILEEAQTFTTNGYQAEETSKPTASEKQGLVPPNPFSLLRRKDKQAPMHTQRTGMNGRYTQ